MMKRFRDLMGICLFAALVTACNGANNVAPATSALVDTGMALDFPGLESANLYVANLATVTVYAPNSDSVLRTISKVEPSAIALNAFGNLFVANIPTGKTGNVTAYRVRKSTILRKITQGIDEPRALRFDSAENLFVANSYFRVAEYAPGESAPSRYFPAFYPAALILDRFLDLYVATVPSPYGHGHSQVLVYAPHGKLLRTISQGLATPIALAFSNTGDLFVANYASDDVTVYPPGKTYVGRTISQGIKRPYALAFDKSGNLYVANNAASTVTVYAPGSSTPLLTIHQGVSHPSALIVDVSGNLFVANARSISVYAPGKATPSRTIVKGINSPIALAFGP